MESVTVTYPRSQYKQRFLWTVPKKTWRIAGRQILFPRSDWEIGWLSVYLAVYIPVMFATKKVLGVA